LVQSNRVIMIRNENEGKKEKDSKKLYEGYEGENQNKAQEEMKNFSEKALEIQKKKKKIILKKTPHN
jgi:hypothetical protein